MKRTILRRDPGPCPRAYSLLPRGFQAVPETFGDMDGTVNSTTLRSMFKLA